MTRDVLQPCERERLLLAALGLSRDPGDSRWTDAENAALIEEMPATIRAAAAGAYPMPQTVAEAHAELSYWREREAEMENALGPQYLGQALDIAVEIRRKVVLSLELRPHPAPEQAGVRARAEQALRANPSLSDREISRTIVASATWIGKVRRDLGLPAAERQVTRNGTTYRMGIRRSAREETRETRAEVPESVGRIGA